MKKVTIISTSLDPKSKSQIIARELESKLQATGVETVLCDLRELPLPFAGAADSWNSDNAKIISSAVKESSHIIFAVPVYCYDVNAAAKNVIELIGRSFTNKVVSFVCSAGGESSYMSVMNFANHLMLDFRSIIVPRFVYVSPAGWNDSQLTEEVSTRIDSLISDMQAIGWNPVQNDSV